MLKEVPIGKLLWRMSIAIQRTSWNYTDGISKGRNKLGSAFHPNTFLILGSVLY
jgi:hypothetical protein